MTSFLHRNNKVLWVSVLLGLSLLLTACHSKYLLTGIDMCRSPAWNNVKTAVASITVKKVYRSASGIVLKGIYPQSDQDYIEYIVYNHGSVRVQNWIMEQVIPTFSKKKIGNMLNGMEAYKKS